MSSCDSYRCSSRPVLLIGAILIALISALPYAGSWNDGSRLATVESLVDWHTWQIDDSIFVVAPGAVPYAAMASAYPAKDTLLQTRGTSDKLFIKGHYYSDKSPVPALPMAAAYKVLQVVTGITAEKNTALFCYLLTVLFSGTAYVISVWCVDAMGRRLELSCGARLLVSYSFALATIALPYVRQVNNHILLLAVTSVTMLTALAYTQPGGNKSWRPLVLGTMAGLGYTIDLGVGPVLVLALAGFIFIQTRSLMSVVITLAMAFPWFLLHHWLNYQTGGTFKPANAVPAYFLWPGCPFTPANLTGGWAHKNVIHFLGYAIDMLFGKKGFIGHNMALYLCIPGIVYLLRNKTKEHALVWFSIALIVGTWLLYAATSNNYSGACCSVRWFVPLLAPFYFLLALFLKERPDFTIDLLILAGVGAIMTAMMWVKGPWMQHMAPGYWAFQAVALAAWFSWRLSRKKRAARSPM